VADGGEGIKGLALRKEYDEDDPPFSSPAGRRQVLGNGVASHNFGGTRSARPIIPPGLADPNFRDGQLAGLFVAIMQTMGLDELRIDQRLLRDDSGAMGAIEVDRDIYKQELIIRRRR
jgi:hypothetical protein